MPPLDDRHLWMAPGEDVPAAAPIDWLQTPVSRRSFLQLLGASLALAAANACRAPAETIRPYVRPPKGFAPGSPVFYATVLSQGGFAEGILVESHEGRPTKIEGNPDHPASLGATAATAQAAIWSLYDPERSRIVRYQGHPRAWGDFRAWLQSRHAHWQATGGRGLRLLIGPSSSPTLARQLAAVLQRWPQARWHVHDPLAGDTDAASRLAFGAPAQVQLRCERASVVLSLDGDPTQDWPGRLLHARQLAQGRRIRQATPTLNRLYAIESTPTLFGAMADHRLPLASDRIDAALRQLARALGLPAPGPDVLPAGWVMALRDDLLSHRGRGLIIAGPRQPAHVQALAHAVDAHLGNLGQTMVLSDPVLLQPSDGRDSFTALVTDMAAGHVETLIVLDTNPAYTAPVDAAVATALAQVRERIHVGPYADETAAGALWHVPASHPLESWSDARAFDGTVSLIQPLIAPLFAGRTVHEVLDALLGAPEVAGDMRLQRTWGARLGPTDGRRWQEALSLGVVSGTALTVRTPTVGVATVLAALPPVSPSPAGLEVTFWPDPVIGSGEHAPNAWLQELPKPLTKLTWGNAALISPLHAGRLGLTNGDVVRLVHGDRELVIPVWLHPGQPEDSLALVLGYGRRQGSPVAVDVGTDVYPFRLARQPWAMRGVDLHPTPGRIALATTQAHDRLHGRDIVMWTDLATYQRDPAFARTASTTTPATSLYPEWSYPLHRWGMAIDLGACNGCSACVVACQAENNIPVVGPEQVAKGRAMHWLRIDRYYEGGTADPVIHLQPVPCMHCERAPCELVCPVEATVHSSEGLNDMTYNRCVGTRYCSNNCPYKVRRFNFLPYAETTPLAELRANPDVTIRSRGVMEKCTYCVQRIDVARIQARKDDRPIQDGEILTACQQVCPTEAIVFGDLADPQSRLSRLRQEPTNYSLLGELNTQPRTTYLAKVRNPHPSLEQA